MPCRLYSTHGKENENRNVDYWTVNLMNSANQGLFFLLQIVAINVKKRGDLPSYRTTSWPKQLK